MAKVDRLPGASRILKTVPGCVSSKPGGAVYHGSCSGGMGSVAFTRFFGPRKCPSWTPAPSVYVAEDANKKQAVARSLRGKDILTTRKLRQRI